MERFGAEHFQAEWGPHQWNRACRAPLFRRWKKSAWAPVSVRMADMISLARRCGQASSGFRSRPELYLARALRQCRFRRQEIGPGILPLRARKRLRESAHPTLKTADGNSRWSRARERRNLD